MIKVGMISLGCSKNRVDAELMLGKLQAQIVQDPAEADVIIVNTCGFIESAKQESIDTILEMAEYKKNGTLKGIVVTGCLSERYKEELAEALPEADVFLGMHAYATIQEAVEKAYEHKKYSDFSAAPLPDFTKRRLTTADYTAYVRIADGCCNRCSYCAIPYIRGPLKSRAMEDIEKEVRWLVGKGVKEIVLVAQDTTKYGLDLYGQESLSALIDRIAPIPGVKWLRILYCYPENITEKLLHTFIKYDNVLKYLDIPFQHFADGILTRMNRNNSCKSAYNTVNLIKETSPDFILRTTVITGFPGETEAEFAVLRQAVEDLQFDRLGAFAYSQEEGTPAAEFEDQIAEEVKVSRRDAIMQCQSEISLAANKRRIGKTYEWLAEGYDAESGYYYGRTYAEAPEIDGKVFVKGSNLTVGNFYTVKITDAFAYDLIGAL